EAPIRAIARATLNDHLEEAHGHLRTFARESPYSAGISTADFQRSSPLLTQLFAESLRTSTQGFTVGAAKPKKRTPIFSIGMLILLGVFFALKISGGSGSSTYRAPYQPPRFVMDPIRIPPIPKLHLPDLDFKAPRFDMDETMLKRYLLDICGSEATGAGCLIATEVAEHARRGDCSAVEESMKRLERTKLPQSDSGRAGDLRIRLLGLVARRRCARPTSGTLGEVDAGVESVEDAGDAGAGPP
ncbi:MAG: hypothetical protein R3F43_27825, partial [bacterium]